MSFTGVVIVTVLIALTRRNDDWCLKFFHYQSEKNKIKYSSLKTPPQLKRVTTLPCEVFADDLFFCASLYIKSALLFLSLLFIVEEIFCDFNDVAMFSAFEFYPLIVIDWSIYIF